MLKYSKIILEKVSFDSKLFKKELLKAIGFIDPSEIKELIDWSKSNFKHHLPKKSVTDLATTGSK